MFRSLRFRLPALFLLGIVLAGLVATVIAVRFFQSNTRANAASELRAESAGIVQIYKQQAGVGYVSLANLNLALGGDRVFWVPAARGGLLLAGPLPKLRASALHSELRSQPCEAGRRIRPSTWAAGHTSASPRS